MTITRQIIINLFSAVVTLGKDMTQAEKDHIGYDQLAEISVPRIDEDTDGCHIASLTEQKVTLSHMLLELSKISDEQT